jgi:hypothetical protein
LPYGDHFGMSADGSGRYYLTCSDGASYHGPGSTWWSRSVRGASEVGWDLYPDGPDFVVLADPDDNRFCVVDESHG